MEIGMKKKKGKQKGSPIKPSFINYQSLPSLIGFSQFMFQGGYSGLDIRDLLFPLLIKHGVAQSLIQLMLFCFQDFNTLWQGIKFTLFLKGKIARSFVLLAHRFCPRR